MKYKGFQIEKNNWEWHIGAKTFNSVDYVVFKEKNGEKYFLPGITAFNTIKEAKEKINEIMGE